MPLAGVVGFFDSRRNAVVIKIFPSAGGKRRRLLQEGAAGPEAGEGGKMRIQTKFSDAKFMSAKEKEMAFKNFRKVIDKRDINLMNRRLYKHLHLHCYFIGQFNINGFKKEFSGSGFRRFVEHFDANAEINSLGYMNTYWMSTPGYEDINAAMVEFVTRKAPKIYQEMGVAQQQADSELDTANTTPPGLEQMSFFADSQPATTTKRSALTEERFRAPSALKEIETKTKIHQSLGLIL